LSSDPKVHDLPRVVRIPGFYHHKKDPFLSKVYGGTGRIYTYRGLVDMFPPAKVQPFASKVRYIHGKVQPIDGEFRGQYGAIDGERNDHVMRRIGGMIKAGRSWDYIESEVWKEAQACSPPLSETETKHLLKSGRRYYGG
jgi:hypothetical protein